MHGTVRCVMELSGESIEHVDVQVGFLHRGFEKMCERGTWTQVFPYVDRCNYVSPMLNNVGFALACEKMLGVEVPLRCQYYRMALGELARISDHLTCDGAMAMELGAFTPFLWMVKARDLIWDIMEEETGARLTHSFGRVGGMAKPPTESFKEHTRAVVKQVLSILAEVERLLLGNRIFLDRLEGVGKISAEDAISLGWTGPCLRAAGVPYDVRKAPALPQVRGGRLRRTGGDQLRLPGPIPRAHRGDEAVRSHHRAVPRADAGSRARQRR